MERVLQVVGTMDLGGAETLIMNIYRNIDRSKVQFDFLCHNRVESKYAEEILSMGGRMYCVPGISHVGPIKYQKNLYKFFKAHPEYKTVHSHHDILSGMILRQAKRAGVKNRISHAHNTYTSGNIFKKIILSFFKMYFPSSVTTAYACADIAGRTLYKGKLKNNYKVIPNVIDTEKFRFSLAKGNTIKKELGLGNEIIIGHVGRFSEQKNHKFLVEIFEQILKKKENAHLLLIGEGLLKNEIEQYVNEMNIQNNVHFLGSRSDMPQYFSAMDLLLFPSLYEGLSVAMVEAQASGLPILTSDTVSSEVALTDLVKQLPLTDSVEKWADEALLHINRFSNTDRSIYCEKIKDAGFDVKKLASNLQETYLNI